MSVPVAGMHFYFALPIALAIWIPPVVARYLYWKKTGR